MPTEQGTDPTAPAVDGLTPRRATVHVALIEVARDADPDEQRDLWPLAPWRWVLILTGLGLAAVCGVPAASPGFNGADLGVLISLAIFAAAFASRRD